MDEFYPGNYALEKRVDICRHIEKKGLDYAWRKQLTSYIKSKYGNEGNKYLQWLWENGYLCYGPLGGIIYRGKGWAYELKQRKLFESDSERLHNV